MMIWPECSFYDKALALYEAEDNQEGIARINNESGVVFRDKGDYKTANERFEKSLGIQRHRNDSVGIGYSLEFLGYNQLLIKDYKKSESYLQEALSIRKKLKDKFALMLTLKKAMMWRRKSTSPTYKSITMGRSWRIMNLLTIFHRPTKA